ncbi:hypothetical protein RRG08_038176 [Elysia crispata]|uniref:Uncharacterized protein n=1 Tax=Elysia crispata TaxID=231223 RepID=A0AAE1AMY2_9GAST|nr:hypothetical protein RRG08_038176 [Elysia crispata]
MSATGDKIRVPLPLVYDQHPKNQCTHDLTGVQLQDNYTQLLSRSSKILKATRAADFRCIKTRIRRDQIRRLRTPAISKIKAGDAASPATRTLHPPT